MPLSTQFVRRPYTKLVLVSSLAMLSMSVSQHALAACTGLPATAGNDTVTCSDTNGNVDLLGGNDKITVNAGATVGSIGGNTGNDLIIVNGGVTANINAGNAVASAGDTDRIFVFGGSFPGREIQTGAGTNPFVYFMGGTLTDGSIEIRRGSTNATVVFDGGQLLDSEFEFQSANATQADPINPTIYLRSGVLQGEFEVPTANTANVTLIIDPINSQSAAYYSALAAAATDGGDETISTANLKALLASKDHPNENAEHQMVIQVEEIQLGAGNDTVIFDGAVNTGDGHHNLVLQGEDEGELPELNGGGGTNSLTVRGGSNLVLGEVENFQSLALRRESKLQLTDEKYTFSNSTTVNSGSELHLSNGEVEFNTNDFYLRAADDDDEVERLALLPSYYDSFQTGGILRIGQLAGQASGGDDDDDDDIVALADDDDDDGETPAGSPATVFFNVGSDTFVNNGTITMLNGIVGDQLIINDSYESAGGKLAIDTVLGGSGSPTDNLTLQGTVTGPTTVFVANVGGTGAATGNGATDGIEIATSTTGAFAADSFALAVNSATGKAEVTAGAFAYQLVVTPDAALLQSDILDQVPAYTMSPAVALHYSNGTFDTLYKRLGELRLNQGDSPGYGNGSAWVKGNYSDVDIDPKSGFAFSQQNQGVLFGFDRRVGAGESQYFLGLFGGVGSAQADINATIFGASSRSKTNVDARTFGGYLSYTETRQPGTGLYVDLVAKYDDLELDMSAANRNSSGKTNGFSVGGSGEVGYGFKVGNNLILQPQGQLTYTSYDQDAFTDQVPYSLAVGTVTAESLIGRAGLQLQGQYGTGNGGVFAPYAIVNVLSDFRGDSTIDISGLPMASDIGVTWFNVGGGFTADLSSNFKLYGSADYNFGDLEGWGVTGGGKVVW